MIKLEHIRKVRKITDKLENSIYENPTETYDGKPTDQYLSEILHYIMQDDTPSCIFHSYSKAYQDFEDDVNTCLTMYEGYIINFLKELHGVIYPITDNDEIDESKFIRNSDNLHSYTTIYGKIYNLLIYTHDSIESNNILRKIDCLSNMYEQVLDYEDYGFDVSECRKDMCIECGAMLSSLYTFCKKFLHRHEWALYSDLFKE